MSGVGWTHFLRNVPGHVDMALKLVHPHLGYSQGVTAHVRGQVLGVWLVGALDVGDTGTGQNLHAATTLPHLHKHTEESHITYK